MIQLSELLAKEISEVSGVNEELLGSASDDKAGIFLCCVKEPGSRPYNGSLTNSTVRSTLWVISWIDIIQANYTPGKVAKILEDGNPSPQFYNKHLVNIMLLLKKALNTTTQKQMQFAQMLELRQAGVPIADDLLIDRSTLQNKQKLIDSIVQTSKQQQQVQMQQMQIQMEEIPNLALS